MIDSSAIAALEPTNLRRLYGRFPSGVAAVCALVDDRPQGFAASTFTSVSLDPPLVSVCIRRESRTWPPLRSTRHLGVSILSSSQARHAQALAGDAAERFAQVPWIATTHGAVLVQDSVAAMSCVLVNELAAGDHVIALLRVQTIHGSRDDAPLVFHQSRFRQLIDD